MFDKILVPLDGSKLAERSLELADRLIGERPATIILLRVPVLKGYELLEDETDQRWDRQEAHTYLDEIMARPRHPQLLMDKRVIEGDEAAVIVDTAVTDQVNLLIMSTHGRSGFGRWLLGSVSERVLRTAPCPMLVVRYEEPIRKMLIPLDGSKLAEKAIAPGLETARRLGAQVTLLRVAGETGDGYVKPQVAYAYLQGIAEEIEGDTAVDIVIPTGPVAPAIIEFVNTANIDLIAMTTHGFTGSGRWVYGQITEKVMRGADASLLVIRPPAEELK